MRPLLIAASVVVLAACQPADESNPGELPDDAPPPADSSELAPPPVDPAVPPTATPNYVGNWAAEDAWCSNTVGPERPVVITETEFRGYENTCQITDVQAVDSDEWTATFSCEAEGVSSSQPVRMEADSDELELTWTQEGRAVEWRRCPA